MTTLIAPLATGTALHPEQGGTGLNAGEVAAGLVPTTDGNGGYVLTPGGGGTVNSVVGGANIAVDSTNPASPIVAFSGVLPVANGGTNASTAAAARTSLGAAASGAATASGLTLTTNKLLGRNTAATGAIEEITLGTNLSMTGTTLNAAGGGGGATSALASVVYMLSPFDDVATAIYNNGASGVGATLTTTVNGDIGVPVGGRVGVVLFNDGTALSGIANGLYVVTNTGSAGTPWLLTRSSDFNGSTTIPAGPYFVAEATGQVFALFADVVTPIVFGTTKLPFVSAPLYNFIAGANISVVQNSGLYAGQPTDTTISVTAATGTVTSVGVSGGTTGLTTSGGPVTTSGTITLAGTLAIANGGTNATTAAAARTSLGAAASGAATASGLTLTTNKLLGRNTAATGAIEEITLGTNLSMTGTTLNAASTVTPPGGATTQVQYNSASAFAGNGNFTYDAANNVLTFGTGATKTDGSSDPLDVFTTYLPSGGLYAVATGQTGAIKIALPVALFSLDFGVKLAIEIYDSTDNKACTVLFSGSYVGSTHTWSGNESVQIIGTDPTVDYNVRDGASATTPCIWIGELASTWGDLRVRVKDVLLTGLAANQALGFAATGWITNIVVAFDTVNSVVTNNLVSGSLSNGSVNNIASPVSLVSGTSKTIISTTVGSAGNYLISGSASFIPAASATSTNASLAVSTTANTLTMLDPRTANSTPGTTNRTLVAPSQIFSLAAGATVYLVGENDFTVGTVTSAGVLNVLRVSG